jgi:hypothetical protein
VEQGAQFAQTVDVSEAKGSEDSFHNVHVGLLDVVVDTP